MLGLRLMAKRGWMLTYNKMKCRKIVGMLLKLMKMVEGEMESFSQRGNR